VLKKHRAISRRLIPSETFLGDAAVRRQNLRNSTPEDQDVQLFQEWLLHSRS